MDTKLETTKPFYRRHWKWFLSGGMILSCCLSCFLGIIVDLYLSNNNPVYIELDFPLPARYANTIHSTFTWRDTGDNYFILRREMRVNAPEFSTWESIVDYFDKYLIAQGWKRFDVDFNQCTSYMPETEFLAVGENGYLFYHRADKDYYPRSPGVCLAVWPQADVDRGFNVVLQTVNPSVWASRGD